MQCRRIDQPGLLTPLCRALTRAVPDTIALPSQWAGQRLRSMRDLRSLDSGVALDSIPNQGGRVVRHAPNRRLRLAYELTKDWAGPLDHPYEFHPLIFAQYIEMTGSNALVHPRVSQAERRQRFVGGRQDRATSEVAFVDDAIQDIRGIGRMREIAELV